jgi:methionyl-tRNA formyltransferase
MTVKRIVFMGTPEFACPTLQVLLDRPEEVIAVFTQPDRPKGRGQKLQPPPVKELALAHELPVYQPAKIRDTESVELIRELAPDLIVVVAFGQILPKALLDIPPYGCINVHASLLPRYRGAAPLNWCLINGETETGVTTMMMDVGLDTGDMLLKRATAIDPNEDIASLHDRLSIIGGELLGETLDRLWDGTLPREQQDDSASCYAPMLKKEHGNIDWRRSAQEIHNQVRGLSVWPGALTMLDSVQLKLYDTRVGSGAGAPGEIIRADKSGIEIACGVDSLLIGSLQLAGKKRLDYKSFLAGCPLAVGAIMTNPADTGESA